MTAARKFPAGTAGLANGPEDSLAGGYDLNAPQRRGFSCLVGDFLAGKDSPRHFLERSLERIALREGDVRAFASIDADNARNMADDASVRYREGRPLSPVDGMPVGIKDIIDTVDLPTEMNSPIYAGYRPRRDAACVVALKAAGAVLLGKTVTTEFACGRSGPTRNPYGVALTPGGSSSGSAAAVGAGMIPGAVGTQTQASVIRPASYCGTFALKPSQGLLRFDGCAPLAPTMDTLGLFGASLEDAWGLAASIASLGPDLGGPATVLPPALPAPVRPARLVHLETAGWSELGDEEREAFAATVSRLAAAGVEIVDRSRSDKVGRLEELLQEASSVSIRIFAYESQWPLRGYAALGNRLVGERGADDIERVDLYAARNVLGPIRFDFAETELQGKFCFQFLLGAIMVAGKAGKNEFTNAFVRSAPVVAAQRKVFTHDDPAIEAMGFDKIRSRIEVRTADGRNFTRWADENYRGGPFNPLSDRELEEKFSDAASGLLSDARCADVFEFVWSLQDRHDATDVLDLLDWGGVGRK